MKYLAAVAVAACALVACGGGSDDPIQAIADSACQMVRDGQSRADVIDYVTGVIRDVARENGTDYNGQPIATYVDERLLADC